MKTVKRFGKALLCAVLERQVRQLRRRHSFTVIAVAGSVGKTSTKLAIVEVLAARQRVRYQAGNYNDRLTVPLIFFGQTEPGLFDIAAWLRLIRDNRRQLQADYPYDCVVVELGTDGPGQLKAFAYLRPEIAVLTAVSAEHMEYFKTLDAVAQEELCVADYAGRLLVNRDDVDGSYLAGRTYTTYGIGGQADYQVVGWQQRGIAGDTLTIKLPDGKLRTKTPFIGRPGAKIALAAAAAAHLAGMTVADIAKGLESCQPFAGRMRLLKGSRGATIIDDTYNASPAAVEAALDVLYASPAPQRLAILGTMNELGGYSPAAHQEVGSYCDAAKLDWVITIGADAERYLAPAASAAGCQVRSFHDPYAAGEFAKSVLAPGAVVLGEGSQNGVFAEEALKLLLADPADARQLVRQSDYWLRRKQQSFNYQEEEGTRVV